MDFSLKHPERASSTPTVVVLAVHDEDDLLDHADIKAGFCAAPSVGEYILFYDQDLGERGEHTALATVSTGEEFRSLPLAGAMAVT